MIEPGTLQTAKAFLKKVSFTPAETLSIGAATCSLIGAFVWVFFLEQTGVNLFLSLLVSFVALGLTGLRQVATGKHGSITFFGARIFKSAFEAHQKSIVCEGWQWVFPFMGVHEIATLLRPIDKEDVIVTCIDGLTGTSFEVEISKVSITHMPWHVFRLEEVEGGLEKIDQNLLDNAVEAIRDQASGIGYIQTDDEENENAADETAAEVVTRTLNFFAKETNQAVRDRLLPGGSNREWVEPSNFGTVVTAVQLGTIRVKSDKLREALEMLEVERQQQKGEAMQVTTLEQNARRLAALPPNALHAAMVVSRLAAPDKKIIIEHTGGDGKSKPAGHEVIDAIVVANEINQKS